MYQNNKMHWPPYPPTTGPTMLSPAMQAPGPTTAIPNASYAMGMHGGMPGGYPGYPTSVGGVSTMAPGTAAPPPAPSGAHIMPDGTVMPGTTGQEESYIENILRMNLGKVATIYMTFENNRDWNAKVFKGVLEAAGRDHVIISDPTTGRRFLLLMVNLDYVIFDEPLNYAFPFGAAGAGSLTRSR